MDSLEVLIHDTETPQGACKNPHERMTGKRIEKVGEQRLLLQTTETEEVRKGEGRRCDGS